MDDFAAGQAISHPRPMPACHSRPASPSARILYLVGNRSELPNVALDGL
jgi:hypothetical protein